MQRAKELEIWSEGGYAQRDGAGIAIAASDRTPIANDSGLTRSSGWLSRSRSTTARCPRTRVPMSASSAPGSPASRSRCLSCRRASTCWSSIRGRSAAAQTAPLERAPRVGGRRALPRARAAVRARAARSSCVESHAAAIDDDRAHREDVRHRLRIPARRRLPVALAAWLVARADQGARGIAALRPARRRGRCARRCRSTPARACGSATRPSFIRWRTSAGSRAPSRRAAARSSPAFTSPGSRAACRCTIDLSNERPDPRGRRRRRDEQDDHEPVRHPDAPGGLSDVHRRARREPGYVPHGLYWDTRIRITTFASRGTAIARC